MASRRYALSQHPPDLCGGPPDPAPGRPHPARLQRRADLMNRTSTGSTKAASAVREASTSTAQSVPIGRLRGCHGACGGQGASTPASSAPQAGRSVQPGPLRSPLTAPARHGRQKASGREASRPFDQERLPGAPGRTEGLWKLLGAVRPVPPSVIAAPPRRTRRARPGQPHPARRGSPVRSRPRRRPPGRPSHLIGRKTANSQNE